MSDLKAWRDGYTAGFFAGKRDAKHYAHWVKFGSSGSDYSDRWQCSSCKGTARAESWGKKCEYERCPHCGAKMDGETNKTT